jgi:hypothetical protein
MALEIGADRHFAESPCLFWPADRAWCVATEVDFDSTLVSGSTRSPGCGTRSDRVTITGVNTNPGGAVYGTITVGALMAAETGQRETYVETIAAVLIALLLYWLDHAYAALTGQRLADGTKLTPAALGHELSMLAGAAVPMLTVLIGWAAGAALATSLTLGVITAALAVVAVEVLAAVRAELSGRELVGQVAIGGLLGCLVFALKAVLH